MAVKYPAAVTCAPGVSSNLTGGIAYVHSEELLHQRTVPCLEGRAELVHGLIEAFGLLQCPTVQVITPRHASVHDLLSFHSEEYIQFLLKTNDMDEDEFEISEESEYYGFGYDCPFIPCVFEVVSVVGGSTLCAAEALCEGKFRTAVNWYGGWHHARKDKAAGFCYVNDIVLGILVLMQKYRKVLYVDFDVHHGDGVEDAFLNTSRVFCLSVHKYETGFYPGSGALCDTGYGRCKFYNMNIPLHDGVSDEQYTSVIVPLLQEVFENFKPEAVVCQCGADGLAGDPSNGFNLTVNAFVDCFKVIMSWDIPLMVLGGGGYNHADTARCWTVLFSLLVGKLLPEDIPFHDHIMAYSPGFDLYTKARNLPNFNSKEYMKVLRATLFENLSKLKQNATPGEIEIQ